VNDDWRRRKYKELLTSIERNNENQDDHPDDEHDREVSYPMPSAWQWQMPSGRWRPQSIGAKIDRD
jgi:hypothetical protein